jgi:calpain-15
MYKLFVLNKNPAHIYGVRLFIDGIWKTIVLDACFPCIDSNRFFGAQPHNNKVWVLFLEKAWAKVYKTYENIHGGLN